MRNDVKITSLFLFCDCGQIDKIWSVKCSKCKNYRDFKSSKNNGVNSKNNKKNKIAI